jgi:uncharacterized membrane protein YfcA
MSELWWVSLLAGTGAILTFFSGFGLGTIMLPVFSVFYPLEVAIAMTAIVHLVNNLFKLILMVRYANWRIIARFGIPSLPLAALGAFLLNNLSELGIIGHWGWASENFTISWIGVIIGLLMIFFALVDVLPIFKNVSISRGWIPIGGALSGFFGGLTGHQGAFRSAFLIKTGMEKRTFIATGVVIACGIDLLRLSIYQKDPIKAISMETAPLLLPCLAAIVGSIAGNYLLSKVTLKFIQYAVGIMLIFIGIGISLGLI